MDLQLTNLSELSVGVSSLHSCVGVDTLGQDFAVLKVINTLKVLFQGCDDGTEWRVSIEAKVVGSRTITSILSVIGLQDDALGRTMSSSDDNLVA